MAGDLEGSRSPCNLEAERCVLGAVLLDNCCLERIVDLKPSDFFLKRHQTIFRRIMAMANARQSIDLVLLTAELERHGELERCDGAAYVAQLLDGIPRVNNVASYAKLVWENSRLRRLAHEAEALKQSALEPSAELENIQARARDLVTLAIPAGRDGFHPISALALLNMELPSREMVLDPVLPVQGLAMLYSKRGVGKTWVALGIAKAVACGELFLKWKAPKPRSVLYVDGELPAATLKERVRAVCEFGAQHELLADELLRLQFISPDLLDRPMPDLTTSEGQALIEARLDRVELLILDPVSVLFRSGKENEGESWLPAEEWLLRLRQRGLAVLLVHHAGKGGAQRGTSRREDILDTVIALRHPTDYSPREGLRCEVHYEKCRSFLGDAAKEFEVRMDAGSDGKIVWPMRDLEDALLARAAELFEEGESVRDVAEELKISKSRAGRLRRKWEEGH